MSNSQEDFRRLPRFSYICVNIKGGLHRVIISGGRQRAQKVRPSISPRTHCGWHKTADVQKNDCLHASISLSLSPSLSSSFPPSLSLSLSLSLPLSLSFFLSLFLAASLALSRCGLEWELQNEGGTRALGRRFNSIREWSQKKHQQDRIASGQIRDRWGYTSRGTKKYRN